MVVDIDGNRSLFFFGSASGDRSSVTGAGLEQSWTRVRFSDADAVAVLMDRLEYHGHKEGSVIEIAAKRLRHSVQTAVRYYADLRTARGQKATHEAWEAPAIKLKEGGLTSCKCRT